MDRVIRHEDGSQITSQEWNAIKASARMLKYELRQLPLPLDRRAQNQSKTKVFYKQYYPKEWTRMILQLEEDQPLLKLCCSHWKAEHVLNNCLMNDRNKTNEDSDNNNFNTVTKKTITTQRDWRAEMQIDTDDQAIRSKYLFFYFFVFIISLTDFPDSGSAICHDFSRKGQPKASRVVVNPTKDYNSEEKTEEREGVFYHHCAIKNKLVEFDGLFEQYRACGTGFK